MSANNFWDNFTHGFMHGMFNNNPFLGCMNWGWSFNSWCNPLNSCFFPSQMNLYTYPDVMFTNSIFPMMQDFPMPQMNSFKFDLEKLFPTDNWQQNIYNNYYSNPFNNILGDTFQKSITFSAGLDAAENPEGQSEASGKTFSASKKRADDSTQGGSLAVASNDEGSVRPAKMTGESVNDKYFDKMLNYILGTEGGLSDDPVDRGGRTYRGVTQKTYDGYRRNNGLVTQDVSKISQKEIKDIYYEIFTSSGADKIDNPQVALVVFDIAVNSGPAKAKELFKKSGGDIKKLEQLRRDFYASIVRRDPSQNKFIRGWNNRVTNTMNYAIANFPDKVLA